MKAVWNSTYMWLQTNIDNMCALSICFVPSWSLWTFHWVKTNPQKLIIANDIFSCFFHSILLTSLWDVNARIVRDIIHCCYKFQIKCCWSSNFYEAIFFSLQICFNFIFRSRSVHFYLIIYLLIDLRVGLLTLRWSTKSTRLPTILSFTIEKNHLKSWHGNKMHLQFYFRIAIYLICTATTLSSSMLEIAYSIFQGENRQLNIIIGIMKIIWK